MYCSLTLQRCFTHLIYVGSALGMQGSDINAYISLIFALPEPTPLTKPISATVRVHIQWMIQRSVDLKQHIPPHICTMYPAQLYNIFTIMGDMSLINP